MSEMKISIMLWLIGLSGGFFVAAGTVALIAGLGIINRYAGITHTTKNCRLYESCILAGSLFGTLISMYRISVLQGRFLLMAFGISAGIYVGSWILALAEMVKMFPIFFRRLEITKGVGGIVLSIAAGKIIGSMLQFYMNW